MDVLETLLRLSHLTPVEVQHGDPDPIFKDILHCLDEIHTGKSFLYGDYIKNNGDEPESFMITQHFCDIKRKFVRLENMVKKLLAGEAITLEMFMDVYADMAIYSAMGIQLMKHYTEKKEKPYDTEDEIPF